MVDPGPAVRGGETKAPGACRSMSPLPARRLRDLPLATVLAYEVPVAVGLRARLLGLAWLDRDEAGCGLLIPRCASVHTFGMRFRLDVYFLDEAGAVLACHRRLPRCRLVACRGASAALEIPAGQGGEISSGSP
jgi:uncharacterized membrane protein (UPF0127 family)